MQTDCGQCHGDPSKCAAVNCAASRADKSSVVACFYQNPDYDSARPLCSLALSKVKIDETLIWPVRYWFYRLVSLVENLRLINYKVPVEWLVFPAPVFENQVYINFFAFALVVLNRFADFDLLTFERFKSAVLVPLVKFMQPGSEHFVFNRHLLNFALAVTCGPGSGRGSSKSHLARFLKEFIVALYDGSDNAACNQLLADVDAFAAAANETSCYGLGFEAFESIHKEIFLHGEKLYTWQALRFPPSLLPLLPRFTFSLFHCAFTPHQK
ncbi:MAG: hypothetical protein E6Q06_01815 [Candidatus Moraniibacteriota bacterium]|nr:MAG: hypothetical protein E6Q06_01815 [Candidatus Moranbacteria bacterium]